MANRVDPKRESESCIARKDCRYVWKPEFWDPFEQDCCVDDVPRSEKLR